MDRGPVFVAGIERSGTSLMYALLASHPSVAMTRRTNLWRYFYNRYGDLGRPANLERCLASMMRYKRLQVLKPDPRRIRDEFGLGEPTYGRLISLLVAHHLERTGKPRWGDKSLNTEHYVEDVFKVFPDAKILHMVRDPRDRYASVRTRWGKRRGGVGVGIAMWLASVNLAWRNQQRYPSRYKIVRYETLAADPERSLRDICAFIGEEYTPAMLSMEGAGTFREKGGNSSYGPHQAEGISTRSIGRFRQVLSKQEIAVVQTCAAREMVASGYDLESIQLTPGERLRFYSYDWPANVAKMLAWYMLEVMKDQIGRTPSPHTIVDVTRSSST